MHNLITIRSRLSRRIGYSLFTLALLIAAGVSSNAQQPPRVDRNLEEIFRSPPAATRPWCYWYWMNDNISREGITRDLESMKRVGISEAFIGNIFIEDHKAGTVKALSKGWWDMVEHAIREGGRIGVDISLFNCPGWSQSGGPWIKPEQSMRYLACSETRVRGPGRVTAMLPAPKQPFQDVCALAFPVPKEDANRLRPARIRTEPNAPQTSLAFDGDHQSVFPFPGLTNPASKFVVEAEADAPFTARSLVLWPSQTAFVAKCELSAADEQGAFHPIRDFAIDRLNTNLHVGFAPFAPVSISFPPVNAKRFRLTFSAVQGPAGLAEIELLAAPRVERYMEKLLAKMHPTPLPMWDAYLWPASTEADSQSMAVNPEQVRNISTLVKPDGSLAWNAPEGEWILLRIGMVPTGVKNSPASPEGQGLEVDKMNADLAQAHFDAFIGKLLERFPNEKDRRAFKRVIADSYEMGSQNWTDGLAELFKARYGYDPLPFLVTLTGRQTGGAEASDRFLWDLRRLVADRISYGYVGGMRRASNARGLRLWLENYGHWGFPGEFLQYGGQSDDVGGEFWSTGELGSIELRAASSAAHIYGKQIASAEAFTSVLLFQSSLSSLKKRGDWAMCEGINHWVLTLAMHQPWEDRLPGINSWFSTEFNRHNTWFEQSREWINYYRRCHYLLRQGAHVADVAYFIGEDTPKMTGTRQPALPFGYDFDYINAEVIEKRLKVRENRFVLPDGKSYQLLVLPPGNAMRPELLRKIRDLVHAGGSVLGNPPQKSPSLQNFPECDRIVRALASELWPSSAPSFATNTHPIRYSAGKGSVFQGMDLHSVLDALGTGPDVSNLDPKSFVWTHRSDGKTDIFFVANQTDNLQLASPIFRVKGRIPELWDAVNGTRTDAPAYKTQEHGTRVALALGARESVFVVFRHKAANQPTIAKMKVDLRDLLSLSASDEIRMTPATLLPEVQLTASRGVISAEVATSDPITVTWTDGSESRIQGKIPAPIAISGPWQLRFPPKRDVPTELVLAELAPIDEHSDPAIRHFSGTVSYFREINIPDDRLRMGRSLWLDLGRVESVAEVTLNGKSLGVIWKTPYLVNISKAARPGANTLEVRVTGTWRNRLIGDIKYPNGFVEGKPLEFKPWLCADPKIPANEPLSPFGLIGPVSLRTTESIRVPKPSSSQ